MSERDRAIELAISQIERQFGKGAIMKMGEANAAMQIDSIPTGTIALDLALGIGGIPRGRVTEIYGPESSGKTTLALHVIAEAQRMGGIAAYIDAEHALDPLYASRLGVNLEDLLISQPDSPYAQTFRAIAARVWEKVSGDAPARRAAPRIVVE